MIRYLFNKMMVCVAIIFFLFFSSTVLAVTPIVHIERWQTPNGAEVYFVHAPQIPMVDVQVVFAAGSAYDGNQWGIASFVNSMLDQGTEKHDANQIAEAFDNVGAQTGGAVDQDKATVSLRSLIDPKYLNPALTTFTETLTEPSFPEKAFERVKNQTIAAIQQNQQQPSSVAGDAFYKAVYQGNPYAHPSLGTIDSVKALTPNDVKVFYDKFYVARNADVIIVGDVSKAQAKNIAEKIMGALSQGSRAPTFSKAKSTEQAGNQFISFPSQQNTIILGQVGITRQNPNYFPLVVGNHILGGLPLTSILFEKIRNQSGLAYGVQSQFIPLQYRGPFFIALQTRSDKAKEALEMAKTVLENYVKHGPTKSELKEAKQNLLGSFPLKVDTNSDIVANVSNIAFYRLPIDYLDQYKKNVSAVTVEQIKKAFQAVVHPGKLKVIVVGSQL